MSVNEKDDIEVDYEVHNNIAFVQIELWLQEENVE